MKKTIIITGASGNLGSAIVRKFLEEGYHVVGIVHKKSSVNQHLSENYEEVVLDLLDEKSCQETLDKIIKSHNSIDVAVFTAGGFAMGDVASTGTADILNQYRLNFETTYNLARPVFMRMLNQNSGRIFLTGSRAGYNVPQAKGVTAYALSKSLVFRLAELMNAEAKGKNVVTTVVVPSIIDTPQNRKDMPDADYSRWVAPAEIAKIISWYSSEEAEAIREPVIKIYKNS